MAIIIAGVLAFLLPAGLSMGAVLGIVWVINTIAGISISYVSVALLLGGIFVIQAVISALAIYGMAKEDAKWKKKHGFRL